MRLLQFRIGVGDQGAVLAQSEAPLPKHPLALAHSQANSVARLDPSTEGFPIPQGPARAEWHRCTAWRSLAQFAAKLEKGAHVQVEGQLRYREYEKDYGTTKKPVPVKHRVAEIHVNRILKLDRAERQEEPAPDVDPTENPA